MRRHTIAIAIGLALPLAYAAAEAQAEPAPATQGAAAAADTNISEATEPSESAQALSAAETPPNAKPGECYARVLLPAKYATVKDEVVIKEATEKITIIPPQFETSEEKIELRPSYTKLIPVPATYKDVNETIEVKPAERLWVSSLDPEKAFPVNPAILGILQKGGIDLNQTEPNTCYREYFQPRSYATVDQEIEIQKERNETEVLPATFESVEKSIEIVPATKKLVEVPAEYEEIEQKVLLQPERTVWKKGSNPAQRINGATGEIMCLVKVPAKYTTIKKRVLKSPPHTEVEEVPAQTRTLTIQKLIEGPKLKHTPIPAVHTTIQTFKLEHPARFVWQRSDAAVDKGWHPTGHQVCLIERPAKTVVVTKTIVDTPASVEKEMVDANITTVEIQKLVAEAKVEKTPIPAVTKTVMKNKKIAPSHLEWRRILCQTNMTENALLKIQKALIARGYDPGKADGKIGKKTRDALAKFQKDNKLATGGITYETLSALKILP